MKSFTTFSAFPVLAPALALLCVLCGGCGGSDFSEATDEGLVVIAQAGQAARAPVIDDHGHDHEHAAPDGSEPALRSYFHDFGRVPDGEVASHTFRLRNTDRLPLTIKRMSPSCGCTVPAVRYFKENGEAVIGQPSNEPEILVIPPLAEVELTVSVDTSSIRNKNVQKLMQVRITTDSQNDPYLTLECSLMVEQAFRVDGNFVSLGKLPTSIGGFASTQISQIGDTGAVLTGVGATPPGIEAKLTRSNVVGRGVWDLLVTASPPLELGNYAGEVELLAQTREGEPRASWFVEYRGTVVPDILVTPNRIIFEDFRGDGIASVDAEVRSMIPGARFRITGAVVEGPMKEFIEVEWSPIGDPDATSSSSWSVRATARPDIADGRFSGTITIETDDSQTPRIDIIYAGI